MVLSQAPVLGLNAGQNSHKSLQIGFVLCKTAHGLVLFNNFIYNTNMFIWVHFLHICIRHPGTTS